MKKASLLMYLIAVLGCHQNSSTVTPAPAVACDATQNFAKTVTDASQLLVGNWKLNAIKGGWVTPTTIPDQSVAFRANGTCFVSKDGQDSGPFAYSITNGVTAPSLIVNDTSRTVIGRSTLLICTDEMILDYGVAIDAQAYVYRRTSP